MTMRLSSLLSTSLLVLYFFNMPNSHALEDTTDRPPIKPKEFAIVYELTAGFLTLGEMHRTLYFDEEKQRYIYDSRAKPTGYAKMFTSNTLNEHSEWIIHENRPRSLRYTYDRTKSPFTEARHIDMRFDWDKKRVITKVNGDPWSLDIPDDTIDKLLYHLAVVYDLQNAQKNLNYTVADGGKIKHHTFELLGKETVKTKLGEFKTIKIKLPGKRDTFIWCAAALDYLPVKLEQSEKRGTLLMQIISAEIGGKRYE